MDLEMLRSARLRSHRLTDAAVSVVDAARQMTATQAQEFWGGRWALGVRTGGAPTLREVDAAFERGDLVRTWTQRGTLHIVPAEDVGWMLAVTAERQRRQHASIHRGLGLDAADIDRAEAAVRAALAGGNRLTRAEFAQIVAGVGVDPVGMRGSIMITALSLRGAVVFGPVVPREATAGGAPAPTREQYLVLAEEWLTGATQVTDPLAELFVRYLRGHGPAGLADFRWWAGLPLGPARAAREGAGDRVLEVEDGLFVASDAPEKAVAAVDAVGGADTRTDADILALPGWDEYFLSYADRSFSCPPERLPAVGPTLNGLVRPVLVSAGEVIGTWSHSVAVGRHHLDPVASPFEAGADEAAVAAGLARFARFLGG